MASSSAVRKFVFVPTEFISRFGSTPNVQRIQSDSLRDSARSVLDKKDIPEDRRAIEFAEEQQRYLKQKEIAELPFRLNIESEPVGVGKSDDVLYAVVNSFQRGEHQRDLALRLVSFLPGIEGLQWNRRGEIIIDGQRIPGSSLAALVRDVISPLPTTNPVGSDQFAQVLRRTTIPGEVQRESTGRYGPGLLPPQSPSILDAPSDGRDRGYPMYFDRTPHQQRLYYSSVADTPLSQRSPGGAASSSTPLSGRRPGSGAVASVSARDSATSRLFRTATGDSPLGGASGGPEDDGERPSTSGYQGSSGKGRSNAQAWLRY